MENGFFTLQDFLIHAEGVTYWLLLFALCFIGFYWLFLSERDK